MSKERALKNVKKKEKNEGGAIASCIFIPHLPLPPTVGSHFPIL
jgi:hypothetical protein